MITVDTELAEPARQSAKTNPIAASIDGGLPITLAGLTALANPILGATLAGGTAGKMKYSDVVSRFPQEGNGLAVR